MADDLKSKGERWLEQPLTRTLVLNLAAIVAAAEREQRIRRMIDGTVYTGTVRHLVTDYHAVRIPGDLDDVRTSLLRVTLRDGVEVLWPVMEVAEALDADEAAFRATR